MPSNSNEKIHDRQSHDLPINAVVGSAVIIDPFGDKVTVTTSLRDDPLGRLYARGQVCHASYEAGRHWQRMFEDAQIGNVKAIDTTKEPVDGGRFPEPVTDHQRKAMNELNRAKSMLGEEGNGLITDILGHRMFIEMAAARRGRFSKDGKEYIGRRFRECLQTLEIVFRYSNGRA